MPVAAGANGGTARPTGDAVDFRRFRTWDAEPSTTDRPSWMILARYGYVRLVSSWAGRTLLILLGLAAVISVGMISYAFASGVGVESDAWSLAMSMYAYPFAAILLLVGGPLFADDVRFNAPLFYFSKPLRAADYFKGKLAFLASLTAAAVVAPILLLLLLALVVGVPAGHVPDYADRPYYYTPPSAQEVAALNAEWHASHIESFGEWLSATTATLPGILLTIAMFGSLMVACSVYTRRGWHASMAFVALVGGTGMAGAVIASSLHGAASNLASPFGWSYLMVGMPLELMFPPARGLSVYQEERLAGAAAAIPVAYLLAGLVTVGALVLSARRLRRLEASL